MRGEVGAAGSLVDREQLVDPQPCDAVPWRMDEVTAAPGTSTALRSQSPQQQSHALLEITLSEYQYLESEQPTYI